MCNQTYIPCSNTECHDGVGVLLELIPCENAHKTPGCTTTYTPTPTPGTSENQDQRAGIYCPLCRSAQFQAAAAERVARRRERRNELQRARRAQVKAGKVAGSANLHPRTTLSLAPGGGSASAHSGFQPPSLPHADSSLSSQPGNNFHSSGPSTTTTHTTNHTSSSPNADDDADDIAHELQQMARWADGLLRDLRPLWDDHLFVKSFCEFRDRGD